MQNAKYQHPSTFFFYMSKHSHPEIPHKNSSTYQMKQQDEYYNNNQQYRVSREQHRSFQRPNLQKMSGNQSMKQPPPERKPLDVTLGAAFNNLFDIHKRGKALESLVGFREKADLPLILWNTPGVITILLQEVVAVYPYLNPPNLTAEISNRAVNAVSLLQLCASHPEIRTPFLNAYIPIYLYPFLNTTQHGTRPFQFLRITALGVIGALVKFDDPHVVDFLIKSEIVPLSLVIIETGSDISKTVATFIIQRILSTQSGQHYICHSYKRFVALSTVLTKLVALLVTKPNERLLKHVLHLYIRLAHHDRARSALRIFLPPILKPDEKCPAGTDAEQWNNFRFNLKNDPQLYRAWMTLIKLLAPAPSQPQK